jgi:hypothetical protein
MDEGQAGQLKVWDAPLFEFASIEHHKKGVAEPLATLCLTE